MNKIFSFWKELKRRNVVRRNTVYAATAFVILELVSIIEGPLKLPEWTLLLVMILLSIGFIVSIILSWLYDINPEGALEKTKPAHKVKNDVKPVVSSTWKIASIISFIVIVVLLVLNIMPRRERFNRISNIDKSIAVLPFINDSSDEENEYIINGTMEAILNNLSKIADLRVVSRTSVEQYRGAGKPTIPEIAKAMNVSYILEGSGQKYGNNIRLTLQLIDAINDRHVWSSPYSREIELDEIFVLQSEIAQLVATEIEAIITHEEKELIKKTPTTNLTAYDFYQRGIEEEIKFFSDNSNRAALEKAKDLFYRALENDSTFAQAYSELSWVYWFQHYEESYFSETFMDSMLILADIALSYDDKLSSAYDAKGFYYSVIGKTQKAIEEYDKELKLNPNSWEAYRGKGWLYWNEDLLKTIDNFYKVASLNRGPTLPTQLRHLSRSFMRAGFIEQSKYYNEEAFKLDENQVANYWILAESEFFLGNFEQAIEYGEKGYALDTDNASILFVLGESYLFKGQFEQALNHYKKFAERQKALGNLNIYNSGLIGYSFWQNGFKEEGEYYFDEQVKLSEEMINKNRLTDLIDAYYNLARVYAFRGERDKAYENLRTFNQWERMPLWMVTYIKNDPLFDNLRDEPEFQQIMKEVEAKYQAEHERVRKWLVKNDML